MTSSDSEDDSMPLSALKRSVAKKPRSSEADSYQPTLSVQKVPPKKVKIAHPCKQTEFRQMKWLVLIENEPTYHCSRSKKIIIL